MTAPAGTSVPAGQGQKPATPAETRTNQATAATPPVAGSQPGTARVWPTVIAEKNATEVSSGLSSAKNSLAQSTPVQSTPAHPKPVQPTPAQSTQVQPRPVQPAPVQPTPAQATYEASRYEKAREKTYERPYEETYEEPRQEFSAGPSFLGLNTPAHAGRYSNEGGNSFEQSSGRDSFHRSSNSLEYLLDDEEEPKRGRGKIIVGVLVAALALGFGYVHYRDAGFDWLKPGETKPAANNASGPQSGPDAANNNGANNGATPGAAPAGGAPASSANGAPGPTVTDIPPKTNANNPPDSGAASGGAANGAAGGNSAPSDATTTSAANAQEEAGKPKTPADAAGAKDSDSDKAEAKADKDKDAGDAEDETPEAPAAAPKARAGKTLAAKAHPPKTPMAKPSAARPADAVGEAERYIYGRGVQQDCDHGLQLQKPAAQQADTKAMISLGALYSTGTCTPRDLPTSYRWYAMALHKQPDNQELQNDLQRLWSRMTGPERQLAIKLSQ